MRYLKHIVILTIFIAGCQIEDDNAPSPDETFVKYYGDLTSYEASDIEIIYDATGAVAEGLVVFGTKTSNRGDTDYFILTTDLEGNLLDSTSFGLSDTVDVIPPFNQADDWTGDGVQDRFRAEEIAGQIEVIPGFGYATVGSSSVSINALGVSDWRWMTIALFDLELQPLRFGQDTIIADVAESDDLLDIQGNDIILLQDGRFLIVGSEEYNDGGSVHFDTYRLILDLDQGTLEKLPRQGITGDGNDDIIVHVFEKPNGHLVNIGHSTRPSLLGENNGNNGVNVYFLETDANGTPVNSAAFGLDDPTEGNNVVYNDIVTRAIKSSSGYSIAGTSNTSQNQTFGFIMNISDEGIFLSSNSHDSSAFNTENNSLETIGIGVTQASDNNLVLLGQYPNFSSGGSSRGGEGMFVKFNQAGRAMEGQESFLGLADGNDEIVDAVTLPDGKIAAVSNVDFGGGVRLISIIKINDNGSLD